MDGKKTTTLLISAATTLLVASLVLPSAAFATASSPRSPPVNNLEIILTSTSGEFINMTDGSITVVGPASGTMTWVLEEPGPTVAPFLVLKSGSVTLGSDYIPFAKGFATMNKPETHMWGSGTVLGVTSTAGAFTFQAFDISPSVNQLHPLDFNWLVMQLHVGHNEYRVLLHVVTTTVVAS